MKLQEPRGTHDLIGSEADKHNFIIESARDTSKRYGFSEMITPMFESIEVFKRTLGDSSDIVTKEMYSFEDRSGELFVLRPEGTASIARAFISHKMGRELPLKFFYSGPMFRYERPQKGRYRQFHQVGIEFLGMESPTADIECISLAHNFLSELELSGDLVLEINSIGDKESRNAYRTALVQYLTGFKSELSEDSQKRLETNPLRILDSKSEADKKILEAAPQIENFLNDESKTFFSQILSGLEALGIKYVKNPNLVRGLDYYNHCVFEFVSNNLGAQSAVLAGGRYNKLIEQMGGKSTPGVGWAAGVERLCLLSGAQLEGEQPIALMSSSEETRNYMLGLSHKLRAYGIYSEIIYSGNMSKQMKKAQKMQAQACLILNDDDLNQGQITYKNLIANSQEVLKLDHIFEKITANTNSIK